MKGCFYHIINNSCMQLHSTWLSVLSNDMLWKLCQNLRVHNITHLLGCVRGTPKGIFFGCWWCRYIINILRFGTLNMYATLQQGHTFIKILKSWVGLQLGIIIQHLKISSSLWMAHESSILIANHQSHLSPRKLGALGWYIGCIWR